MLTKTTAIVLGTVKYSETSLIVKCYSRHKGLISFMVKGVRKTKTRHHASNFQLLNILNVETYYNDKRELQNIKELSLETHYKSLHTDIRKITIGMFLAELLTKSIREEEPNPDFFDFIYQLLQYLDVTEEGLGFFHVYFMLHISRFLGFYPAGDIQKSWTCFDMEEGCFRSHQHAEHLCMDELETRLMLNLLKTDPLQMNRLNMPREHRNLLLEQLLRYYQLHLPGFGQMKSYEVLKQLF